MSDELLTKIVEHYFAQLKPLRKDFYRDFPQAFAYHLALRLVPPQTDWELIALGGSMAMGHKNNWLKRLIRKL